MTNFFRKVNKPELTSTRYSAYGLVRNPFPNKPGVTINSEDKRENGQIYIPELRDLEARKFDKVLIPNAERAESKTIAFLMDYATKQGRGIGKTAFLNFQRSQIMHDFGDSKSNGAELLFAVYCSPAPGEQRKSWQLSKLIIKSMIEQDILAIAMCRIRYEFGKIPDRILEGVTTNVLDTIGDWNWIKGQLSDTEQLTEYDSNNAIKRELEKLDIDSSLKNRLADFGYNSNHFADYFYDKLTDGDWKKNANSLLYNDIVKILNLAGFTKGIILLDELEKIVQYQNTQERRGFCDDLRYWFIDGNCDNTKFSFLSILLVIHPYLQELLNPHWSAAGLERFASLGGTLVDDYTVFFRPIEEAQAVPLALAYLNESRNELSDNVNLHPFTENSLKAAHAKTFGIPGKYLTFLHNAIERGINENWSEIDVTQIEQLVILNQKVEEVVKETDTLSKEEIDLNEQ